MNILKKTLTKDDPKKYQHKIEISQHKYYNDIETQINNKATSTQ